MNSCQESINTWLRFQPPTVGVLTIDKLIVQPQIGQGRLLGQGRKVGSSQELNSQCSFYKTNLIIFNISVSLNTLQWLPIASRIKAKSLNRVTRFLGSSPLLSLISYQIYILPPSLLPFFWLLSGPPELRSNIISSI